MTTSRFLTSTVAAAALAAMTLAVPAEAKNGRNGAAAVGVAAGAAIALGALGLAASARQAPPPPGVYEAPPPPPGVYVEPAPMYRAPPTVYVPAPAYGESPDEAVQACQAGIEDAARQQGAYHVSLNRVMNVRPRGDGHRVRAEMTAYYRGYARTSLVTCETADGYLVSARAS